MNLSDSERVTAVLDQMGYKWTNNEEEAEIVGILACSVRQKAIDKVYTRISKWNKRKEKSNLITFLSGCILPADKEKFLKLFDIVFQMSELQQLPEIISQYGIVTPAALKQELSFDVNNELNTFWNINPKYASTFEAYVPIQNGCDKFCTFCAVPYTRGREVSRPSSEILIEVEQLIMSGFKTITLLGQNVNSYGLDKKGEELSFPQLLDEIGKIGDKYPSKKIWIYYTSPHPRDMTTDVIDVMAKYKCIAKQVHLPVQSGDDKMLIKMNRKHSMNDYMQIINYIRLKLPNATIFTDIIVGFTGETEEQYANTKKAVANIKYNMAYIAMYSQRPGAVSSRWVDDIPIQVKKERHHDLTQELGKHTAVYNATLIGKTIDVLVTHPDRKEGFLAGYNEGKQVIRFASNDASLIGNFVKVKVESSTPFSMQGKLLEVHQNIDLKMV